MSARPGARLLARGVQQALDVLDALHLPSLADKLVDQLWGLDLAAQHDLAVLGVDVDLALRNLGVAEDLGLDLARQRHIVGLRLRLLAQVGDLLLERVRPLRQGAALAALTAQEAREPVSGHLAAALAVLGVEEVDERGAERREAQSPGHRSLLIGEGRDVPEPSWRKPRA